MDSENLTPIICSVIIPHYNIPALLSRCIQSLPECDDVQIIVVDDCSPCAESIAESVPELRRKNVELYSTPKGGSAGRARNLGISMARGKWLTFLDADDLFTDVFGAILAQLTVRNEDVLYYRNKSVLSENLDTPSSRNIFDYHFSTYFETGNELPLRLEFDAPWGKFVRKDFIDSNNIRFDEIRYSNDTFFSTVIGVMAQNIYVSQDILYIVTERSGSLTSEKMKSFAEWEIRYNTALRTQKFLDNRKVKYRRYAFCDYLLVLAKRDKKSFARYFLNLSLRNKLRYIYYATRSAICSLSN